MTGCFDCCICLIALETSSLSPLVRFELGRYWSTERSSISKLVPAITSLGMSTNTGPILPEVAILNACLMASGILSTLLTE